MKYLRKSLQITPEPQRCNETVDQIIDSHVDFMRRNNIKIPEDFVKLPSFHCMPTVT